MAVLPGASELPDDERNMFKRNKEPRFYENDVPEVNSLVMVKVLRVAETSAYVMCLEYSGLEGMILFSEVSTRRIRSMLKEIRAGQFCVCMVLRVDKEKGHLDLSRRRVNADDRAGFLQKYAKSKLVHSTMRQLSAVHSLNCEELCSKIAWPLYKRFPHAIDAFKQYINTRDDSIFKEMDVPEKVKTDMLAIIEKKLTPQAIKLKAKIEVSCYEIEGIDALVWMIRSIGRTTDLWERSLLRLSRHHTMMSLRSQSARRQACRLSKLHSGESRPKLRRRRVTLLCDRSQKFRRAETTKFWSGMSRLTPSAMMTTTTMMTIRMRPWAMLTSVTSRKSKGKVNTVAHACFTTNIEVVYLGNFYKRERTR
ncbi:unnamed protein product [Amoebophrya sp. A25]|nr:unnamed protein product [Amoebophrya sp. A25]|eukprot:GSA25T00013631001.1